jgi:hypothetical protein
MRVLTHRVLHILTIGRGNKVLARRRGRQGGFIALLFVLMLALSLSSFVFTLTRSFSYTLLLVDQYRQADKARSAALYCYYKIRRAYQLDIGYAPKVGMKIDAPHQTSCVYFAYEPLPDAQGFIVEIEGYSSQRDTTAEVFKLKRSFRNTL